MESLGIRLAMSHPNTQSVTRIFRRMQINRAQLTLHLMVDLLGPYLTGLAVWALDSDTPHFPRTTRPTLEGMQRKRPGFTGPLIGVTRDYCKCVAEVETLLLDCGRRREGLAHSLPCLWKSGYSSVYRFYL